jgi:hypothetical protein
MQALAPTIPEYVPVSQAVHADAPVLAVNVPALHTMQLETLVKPDPVEYVPAAHAMHADSPVLLP